MTELKSILARIEARLRETGQSPTGASKAAGKPDAIRNIKRAIKEGKRSGVSTDTLSALADQLGTTLEWLLVGDKHTDGNFVNANELDLTALLAAVEGSYHMLGLDQEEAAALLGIVVEVAQEQPTPSASPNYHRVLAETEARKFLKTKQSQQDGA